MHSAEGAGGGEFRMLPALLLLLFCCCSESLSTQFLVVATWREWEAAICVEVETNMTHIYVSAVIADTVLCGMCPLSAGDKLAFVV